MECDLENLFEVVKSRYTSSGGLLGEEDVKLLEDIKRRFVLCLAGHELDNIYKWVQNTKDYLYKLQLKFNAKGFTLPKEFTSFMANPLEHLKKKLFNYVNDYLGNKIDFYTFLKKSSSAITTSLRTNARSCYQLWGLTAILIHLGDIGYSLVYPEHKFINFDRSGRQKLGVIPPNIVLLDLEKGYLSFFHEAPRPLSWEDTSDLQRIWSLYTALRPDLMVYSGKVLNIVDLDSSPPIKRPNIVIEFKELDDWYLRVRDLKGYLRRPMTAEEWRFRWWYRLREELIKIANLKLSIEDVGSLETASLKNKESSMRVREYQLVLMYKAVYKPDRMFLISRAKVPSEVKVYLENSGVEIYDDIGFNPDKLKDVAYELDRFASYGDEEKVAIEIPKSLAQLISKISKTTGMGYIDTIEYALKTLLNNLINTT